MPVRQLPEFRKTVWLIGDPHIGSSNTSGTPDAKVEKLLTDFGRFPAPAAVVALGDLTQELSGANTAQIDTRAVAFLNDLATAARVSTVHRILGNHDAANNNRTMEAAQTGLGLPSKNQSVDLGFLRLLLLGPELADLTLASATLDWMVAEAAAAGSQKCLVCYHAPLKDTFRDTQMSTQDSEAAGFFARKVGSTNDAEIRTAIASTSNIIGWASGHTHPDLSFRDVVAPTITGLFKTETIGGRSVMCINVPSLYYNGIGGTAQSVPSYNEHWTCPLTFRSDTVVEARWRNHMIAAWDGWRGPTVESLTVT